jgi:membrane protein implicated in regulation of membrane protease activity
MRDASCQAKLDPSRYYAAVLLVLHFGGLGIVYLSSIAWWIKIALCVPISASLAYYWLRDVRQCLPFSWCEISLKGNAVTILMRNGSKRSGMLSDKRVVFTHGIFLRVEFEGTYWGVYRMILPDMLAPEPHRRIRVYLLMNHAAPPLSPASTVIRDQ